MTNRCRSDSQLPVTAYMCMTDYDFELGVASGGTDVYATIKDLKEHRPCVNECGIVEVTVSFNRIVEPGLPYSQRGKRVNG